MAQYLRYGVGQTGTKIVCNEGDCGACSVIGINLNEKEGQYKTLNSCLQFIYLLDGYSIVTIEGLDNTNPVGQQLINQQGLQCGYCTPGFVMSMYQTISDQLESQTRVTYELTQEALMGNLCRCTGLKSIALAMINIQTKNFVRTKDLYNVNHMLNEYNRLVQEKKGIHILSKDKDQEYVAPSSVDEVSNYLPKSQIVAGASDLAIPSNKGIRKVNKCLTLHHMIESKELTEHKDFLFIGPSVTMSEFEQCSWIDQQYPELRNYLKRFASKQIKNVASVVGNVVNASPVGDTIPFLMALGAKIVLKGPNGQDEVLLESFFTGYKELKKSPNQWVRGIMLPVRRKKSHLFLYSGPVLNFQWI